MTPTCDPTNPRIEAAVLQLYGAAHNMSFWDIEIVTGLRRNAITGILRRHHFPIRHNSTSELAQAQAAFRQLLRW